MRKSFGLFALATISTLALTACRFNAPTIEEERTWLTEAGYQVTVTSGNDVDTDNPDTPLFNMFLVSDCVYGSKDNDEIYLIYFNSINAASDAYTFMTTKLKSGQINELVYAGTSQAIKDAKL